MLWLAVPAAALLVSLGALAAIRSLEAARRQLQGRVAALVEAREALAPVQQQIDALRADAVTRAPR